jgi:hypothetical protein
LYKTPRHRVSLANPNGPGERGPTGKSFSFASQTNDLRRAGASAYIFGTPVAFDGEDTREQPEAEARGAMNQREANLLWLRDVLEHLSGTRQQLEWTQDRDTIRVLTESMIRDLERCRTLCESLHQKCLPRSMAS